MTLRRQGEQGTCETRTQGALVAALRARPRTPYRAGHCALAAAASFFGSLLACRRRIAGAPAPSATAGHLPPPDTCPATVRRGTGARRDGTLPAVPPYLAARCGALGAAGAAAGHRRPSAAPSGAAPSLSASTVPRGPRFRGAAGLQSRPPPVTGRTRPGLLGRARHDHLRARGPVTHPRAPSGALRRDLHHSTVRLAARG